MAGYDLHSNTTPFIALDLTDIHVKDEVVEGNILDTLGSQSCEFIIIAIDIDLGGETATWSFSMEHSDDSNFASYEDVSDDFVIVHTPITFTFGTNRFKFFGYVGGKRYVRLKCTLTTEVGDTAASLFNAVALLDHPRSVPVIEG